ncbi:MAG: hemerythrin domain-containing protein [Myxococcota bacterium]
MPKRSRWERHPRFHGQAAMLLQVHDGFRSALDRLVVEPDQRYLFRRLVSVLRHHHHAEEIGLFPLVEARLGRTLDELVADHQALDEAIAQAADGFARGDPVDGLARLQPVLIGHLDREEALVIPVLLDLPPGLHPKR